MADLKVSQLPVVTETTPTDKVIVNTGNPQQTSAITVADLIKQSDENGKGGYTPIYVDVGGIDSWSFGQGSQNRGDVIRTATSTPVKMPDGANRALVFVYFNSRAQLDNDRLPNSDVRPWISYLGHEFTLNGATFTEGGANQLGVEQKHFHMGPKNTIINTDSNYTNKNFESRINGVKFEDIAFSNGASVSFTSKWINRITTWCSGEVFGTRVVILPYASTTRSADVYGGTPYQIQGDYYYTEDTKNQLPEIDDPSGIYEGLYESILGAVTLVQSRAEWIRPLLDGGDQTILDGLIAQILTIFDPNSSFTDDQQVYDFVNPLLGQALELMRPDIKGITV